jgi:hypothetical protein
MHSGAAGDCATPAALEPTGLYCAADADVHFHAAVAAAAAPCARIQPAAIGRKTLLSLI